MSDACLDICLYKCTLLFKKKKREKSRDMACSSVYASIMNKWSAPTTITWENTQPKVIIFYISRILLDTLFKWFADLYNIFFKTQCRNFAWLSKLFKNQVWNFDLRIDWINNPFVGVCFCLLCTYYFCWAISIGCVFRLVLF